eukprot:UN30100
MVHIYMKKNRRKKNIKDYKRDPSAIDVVSSDDDESQRTIQSTKSEPAKKSSFDLEKLIDRLGIEKNKPGKSKKSSGESRQKGKRKYSHRFFSLKSPDTKTGHGKSGTKTGQRQRDTNNKKEKQK